MRVNLPLISSWSSVKTMYSESETERERQTEACLVCQATDCQTSLDLCLLVVNLADQNFKETRALIKNGKLRQTFDYLEPSVLAKTERHVRPTNQPRPTDNRLRKIYNLLNEVNQPTKPLKWKEPKCAKCKKNAVFLGYCEDHMINRDRQARSLVFFSRS